MKILVCGGAGFIGSHFIRTILAKYQDYSIINYDKLTYAGSLENLRDIENNPRYTFVQGDICDLPKLESVAAGVGAIVNFAAESHVDRSIQSPEIFLNTNILGPHTVASVVMKHKIPRYVQISTDEVYGSIEQGRFREDHPCAPNNPYAAAKAAGDLLLRSYHQVYRLPVIRTHTCNNYGPYQFPEKIMPRFITDFIGGRKPPLQGTGEPVREWIYVLDNVNAIDLVLHRGREGESYNISTEFELSNRQLVDRIMREMGKSWDDVETVPDRPANDKRYAMDNFKIRTHLGWEPRISFDAGLQMTIGWYRANTEWLKKIQTREMEMFLAQTQHGPYRDILSTMMGSGQDPARHGSPLGTVMGPPRIA